MLIPFTLALSCVNDDVTALSTPLMSFEPDAKFTLGPDETTGRPETLEFEFKVPGSILEFSSGEMLANAFCIEHAGEM